MRLTQQQETDIQSTLVGRIGQREYDALFRIFLCGEIRHGVAHLYVLNEFHASQVEALYSHDLVEIVAQIVACEIAAVNVWPLASSDRPVDDGATRTIARHVMPCDT